ncbi:MAG TPA: 50S ribosomal protein L29 [Bacteroidales bacterium]|jgi:large subunit ribosomal protein L29|nr:50S ribosomal protein L29 [Bacteroidales bacterium]HNZ43843.1 50S ribosomal protein L29 [Bacteroidales bacterium]HOH83917.1 50S ribosomal protein L29 [Bacteroidales bacterium]HPB26016.1 50S ribosomal protein L29 [Bacteroidales bacterium]HPI30088.1 50S ribosomal protein L29 [Bacteroidales bacterium]
MKQQVISELSTNELRERLEEEKKQYLKLKMNHAISPLENPMKIKDYKRTIARMLTELRKRDLAGDTQQVEVVTKKNSKK